jgi:predicted MFS family arabinose efflux permease
MPTTRVLRLFRSRDVAGANVVQALLVVGMFGMFFLGALYMQRILGYDALQVGLAYLPMTVVMGAVSFRVAGPLALRFGPQATLVPAMAFIAAGLLLLARTPVDATYTIDLMPAMILFGLGAGLGFPSLMALAMSGATASDSGWPRGLSIPASRWAARSDSPCWPRLRPSAPTDCSPMASRPPRRSTPATTSRS